jgi:subtilisin family serine protease
MVDLNAAHEAGIVIIKVKAHLSPQCELYKINNVKISACLGNLQAKEVNKKFPLHQKPASEKDRYGRTLVDLSLIYEIKLPLTQDLRKAINSLLATGEIEYAAPHYTQTLMYTPNDPSASVQYYLDKIMAYQAWDLSQSDTNIVVGVTDTGTDLLHEDLISSVKIN